MNVGIYPPNNSVRRRESGLALMQPGYEQYRVPATGCIVIDLQPDDEVEFTTPYGHQIGDLILFDKSGREALSAVGINANNSADRLQQMLSNGGESAAIVRGGLKRRNISLEGKQAFRFFHENSEAGERVTYHVQDYVCCLIGAPGDKMDIDRQNPPTDLSVVVKRADISDPNDIPLPEPLADPRLDFRINAATAQSYEVKTGAQTGRT